MYYCCWLATSGTVYIVEYQLFAANRILEEERESRWAEAEAEAEEDEQERAEVFPSILTADQALLFLN